MKTFDANSHHRRSIRLPEYNYSQEGAYYITICTHNRECILGNVVNGEMRLNEYGLVVETEWLKTTNIRNNVKLDVFVVMPNHFPGIILIVGDEPVGATRRVASTMRGLKSGSVGAIVGQFKSIVTKNIRKMGFLNFQWPRNYYEHIIRNEKSLNKIRQYIFENPYHWDSDEENPRNIKPFDWRR